MRSYIRIRGLVTVEANVKFSRKAYDFLRKEAEEDGYYIGSVRLDEKGDILLSCRLEDVRGLWDVEKSDWTPCEYTEEDMKKALCDGYEISSEDVISITYVGWGSANSIEHGEYLSKVDQELLPIGKAVVALFEDTEQGQLIEDCKMVSAVISSFEKRYESAKKVGAIFNNYDIGELFDSVYDKMDELDELLGELRGQIEDYRHYRRK